MLTEYQFGWFMGLTKTTTFKKTNEAGGVAAMKASQQKALSSVLENRIRIYNFSTKSFTIAAFIGAGWKNCRNCDETTLLHTRMHYLQIHPRNVLVGYFTELFRNPNPPHFARPVAS